MMISHFEWLAVIHCLNHTQQPRLNGLSVPFPCFISCCCINDCKILRIAVNRITKAEKIATNIVVEPDPV